MAYLPPPYVPAQTVVDPTNVLGRRISAFLIDYVLIGVVAFVVGIMLWFGSATTYEGVSYADERAYVEACEEGFASLQDGTFFQGRYITRGGCSTPTACDIVKHRESLPSRYGCFESGSSVQIASDEDGDDAVAAGFLVFLLIPLNLFLLQGITGASLGKHMLGLRVVRGDGRIAGFGWNALRTLMLFIPDMFCGGVVGLITVCVTKPHRRVGDMAAGTYVVRKTSVGTPITETIPAPAHFQPQQQWRPPAAGTAPMPSATPPWSSPAADQFPEPASAAPGWGAPAPSPEAQPTPTPDAQSASQSASQPASQPVSQPGGAPASDPTQPQWDQARQAYIAWEPTRRRWMQHDATTDEWREI